MKVNGRGTKFEGDTTLLFVMGAFLQIAAGGEEKNLAGVNPVGIVDSRIGLGDAVCVGSAAQLRLGDLRKSVSRLHRELDGGPNGRDRRRQNNLRAGHDVIRVEDARVGDG